MSKRGFLRHSLMLAGATTVNMKALVQAVNHKGKPKLRIGILSDIHIRQDSTTLAKALKYFRNQDVDGVLIAGDMADLGLVPQLKLVSDTWYQVFPNDKGLAGKHVEKLFIYGNHDINGHTYSQLKDITPKEKLKEVIHTQAISLLGREKVWQQLFHEKWSPIYIKDIKGFKFIGAHWANHKDIPGLADFLDKNHKMLQGSKPFFYFQHPHPQNTCSGPWAWGHQTSEDVTNILSHYPNCVAFSGHSHTILNDDRTLWQEGFTSIGTASLSYTYTIGGRENTHIDSDPVKIELPSQMKTIDEGNGKQGMLMTVYDDNITLERRDFTHDEILAGNWILPIPNKQQLSYENRAKAATAPQFRPDDKVSVTRAKGKDRFGKEQVQTTVHFPTVLKMRTGLRAYDYEVALEQHFVDTFKTAMTKRVMSPHFFNSENHDKEEATCIFGEAEIPKGCEFRFAVRPTECFGKKGEAIYSEWQTI